MRYSLLPAPTRWSEAHCDQVDSYQGALRRIAAQVHMHHHYIAQRQFLRFEQLLQVLDDSHGL